MEVITFVAGVIVGIVAVSIAVEFAWKKSLPEKTCKLTRKWNLNELKSPLIATEKLLVDAPGNARVVVASPSPQAKNARENPDVMVNFAVGLNKAYLFAGEIKEGQIAMVTSDEEIMKELKDIFYDFYRKHEKVKPYVATGKGVVKIRGIVRTVFPYREGYMMRVSYEKGLVGVILKEKMDVEGKRVEIEGEMKEYPFINPHRITVLD
ncbi:MAG: hypothetical protein J7L31_06190 [Thermoplasmata archaeon]|nr:hypothetical protein [Thermoplasmata archaeon]